MDDRTLEERLERIERRLFPEEFRRPPKPQPQPSDDLLGPSPEMDEAFLKERFKLLTSHNHRSCWATAEEMWEAREEYYGGLGTSLPARYRDPDNPEVILDRDTGEDITKEVEAEQAAEAKRKERARIREYEKQAQEQAAERGYSDPYYFYESYGLERPDTRKTVAEEEWEELG